MALPMPPLLKSRPALKHDRERSLSIALFFFYYNNTIANVYAHQFSRNVTVPVLSNC